MVHFLSFFKIINERIPHERGDRERQMGPVGPKPALPKYVIYKYYNGHSTNGHSTKGPSCQETRRTIVRRVTEMQQRVNVKFI